MLFYNALASAGPGGGFKGGIHDVINSGGFLSKIVNIGASLLNKCLDIWTFLQSEFYIGAISFTPFDLIFGAGITLVLGYIIIKWIIDFT